MLSSSLFLRATAVLSALSSTALATNYQLGDKYEGKSFLDGFNFFTANDPTNGYVDYVDRTTAASKKMVSMIGTDNYIGVDYSTPLKLGVGPRGRASVRIETAKNYNHGLFVVDLKHMPGGICGTWPAFWSLGSGEWPKHGEIDIIEGVNRNTQNKQVLHTDTQCKVNGLGQSAPQGLYDCALDSSSGASGCDVNSNAANTFGTGFNNNKGGVYAMEWTSQAIKMWFFPRGQIPASILSDSPDTTTFGTPVASFQGGCDIDSRFIDHRFIFDNTFCGDWAGWAYSNDPQCKAYPSLNSQDQCKTFVAENPAAFKDAYWQISYFKTYTKKTVVSSSSSSVVSSTSSSSSLSSSSTSSMYSTSSSSSWSSSASSTSSSHSSSASSSAPSSASSSASSTAYSSSSSASSTAYSSSSSASSTASSSPSSSSSASSSYGSSASSTALSSGTSSIYGSTSSSTPYPTGSSTLSSYPTGTSSSSTSEYPYGHSSSSTLCTSSTSSSTSAYPYGHSSSSSTSCTSSKSSTGAYYPASSSADPYGSYSSVSASAYGYEKSSSTSCTKSASSSPYGYGSSAYYAASSTAEAYDPSTASAYGHKSSSTPCTKSSSSTAAYYPASSSAYGYEHSSASGYEHSSAYGYEHSSAYGYEHSAYGYEHSSAYGYEHSTSTSCTKSKSSSASASAYGHEEYPTYSHYTSETPATTPAGYPYPSSSLAHSYSTTTYTTHYVDVCSTGYTTISTTLTVTYPASTPTENAYPVTTPVESCPPGFTTTAKYCASGCGSYPTTVTVTIPITYYTNAYSHAHEHKPTGPIKPYYSDSPLHSIYNSSAAPYYPTGAGYPYPSASASVHITKVVTLSVYAVPGTSLPEAYTAAPYGGKGVNKTETHTETKYPVYSVPYGTGKPTGTGVTYGKPTASKTGEMSYFTGAASGLQVGGMLGGVAAIMAVFL
ncbi:hypothetical protein BCR34DRAFT_38423 [Clohesyomyces aquaticus]|uniref:endo-1,3(4)-beta-glucanase n=1 Tax=Clohesyomyces aquaticus TaxID=1231657 RepID=A0A1Y2A5Y5_9PLEO|nr:hypothetical protein BCR34DRAFT_38423 [Clohesyomyces aquaticus]